MTPFTSLVSGARAHGVLDRKQWINRPRTDLLSGLVVALALIPEAISFSIIAGVDPKVGLYASFSIAIIISIAGGRPGMISAATGAMALVVVPLVADYGVEYLFAATILAGVIQVGFGYLGVGELMRFVPRTVMLGFVNALAILIFLAQVPHILLSDDGLSSELPLNLAFIAVGLAIIYGLPADHQGGAVAAGGDRRARRRSDRCGLDLPTVGDMGELPDSAAVRRAARSPVHVETLSIIFPFSLTLALVGLLESLLTAQLLDDLTDTDSDKNTESRGQGIANVATGFLGGMAGCAMIGQSMINHRSGGRTRLSTLASGVFLLILILGLGDLVAQIPMAALVAVMIMVSIGTFNWTSVSREILSAMPQAETLSWSPRSRSSCSPTTWPTASAPVSCCRRSSSSATSRTSCKVTSVVDPDNVERLYAVTGELFFASTNDLVHAFDYDAVKVKRVEIDLTDARIWDTSAVAALDTVVAKFEQRGIHAELIGMNKHAERLHARTTGNVTVH